jgi:hypothetical protein
MTAAAGPTELALVMFPRRSENTVSVIIVLSIVTAMVFVPCIIGSVRVYRITRDFEAREREVNSGDGFLLVFRKRMRNFPRPKNKQKRMRLK